MITDQQLKQCIAEIGLLALSTSSYVTKEIKIYEPETSETSEFKWFPSAKVLSTAKALLELAKVFQDNWDAIQQRPLKTLTTEIAPIDIKRAISSPFLLIQAKLNPTKKQTLGTARTESYKCIENEFICYILDVYLTDLTNGIANILDSLTIEKIVIPYISPKFERERSNFMQAVRERLDQRNNWVDKEKLLVTETVTQLRACVEWATQARKAKFLENVVTPDKPPSPSLRLTGSPTYGGIFQQYSNCCTGNLADIEKILYLYEYTCHGQVRPTWDIYKIWCVVRLYSTFILYTNMQPPDGERTLFECIQTRRGMLELPQNQGFKLTGSLTDGQTFTITFWYQPQLKINVNEFKIPDILVQVHTSGDREFQNQISIYRRSYGWVNTNSYQAQYCFNIKEGSYTAQGYQKFIQDVIEISRNTYLMPLKVKASFILHSDIEIDYWGEVPINRILKEKFNLNTQPTEFVGHKYGAIALVPGVNAETQFRKLVQLLFKYHNDSLKTACLACGHQLTWGKDVVPSWIPDYISESELINRVLQGSDKAGSATGVYCSCPNPKCADFWVVQLCYGQHHPLLKLIDCFHRPSDHREWQGKWMYICPLCGSDPSLAQIRASRYSGF